MNQIEPKLKKEIFTKEFFSKYIYIIIIGLCLLLGVSYSLTFFIQNKSIAAGRITTGNLSVTYTNKSISAIGLEPSTDQNGLSIYVKKMTLENTSNIDGKVDVTLARTSGLNLTDMRYALIVNGAIQTIDNVPSNGKILSTAIMSGEEINIEVRLWPKSNYAGNETTFVGDLNSEVKYLGSKAASLSSPAGKYVKFNCSGNNCEIWQIVKVEDGRLVLTRQADYTGATERVNSNRYKPDSFNPVLTFNDDTLITSLSTDGKNVYLLRTVKIEGGSGTQADPYTLINNDFGEPDKKVVAVITYKNGNTTVGTQNLYYNEINYISQVIDNSSFEGWTDNTNDYSLGDTVNFTTDTILTAKVVESLHNKIMTLCNDSNVNYVQKYDDQTHGSAMDTPDGTGSEDVCYYTTISNDRNSTAEQNANVIFGDFCWQIVRTTADGGVKLIYNGPKTNDNKCTSDADTANYNNNPRPTSIGVVGTAGSTKTISGSKKYGESFEIFTDENDNGTVKFRLKNVVTESWSDLTYKDLIGKYVCGTSSSPTGTDETCTVLYYIGHYQSNTKASTEKYTIGTNEHYSQIGLSSYNANYDSPALVGYMYNDVYNVITKQLPSSSTDILTKYPISNNVGFYYGDDVSWDGVEYHLIDTSTGSAPENPSIWTDIRGSVGGKYTCRNNNPTTGKSCETVYYVVANSSDNYMYLVPLSNNETKNKQVTWTYGTAVTKSGDTYMLMDGNNQSTLTKTFKVSDWYTIYNTDAGLKNIYVCEDFTSTTCTTVYYISATDNYREIHKTLNYTYYFVSNINYDSSTNTYSYDTNGTINEVYDWITQYNTINNTHYMCETYNQTTHECGANAPMYYVNATNSNSMNYAVLKNVPNIGIALTNMFSKDTIENNQAVVVNKYNSAIKGVVDNWYKQNIDDKNLTNYLNNNTVYCNDRVISDYGGWVPNGSTTQSYGIRFENRLISSIESVTLGCANILDRFSVNNIKAQLTYPVGLLTRQEVVMMSRGYAKTGQAWFSMSPHTFNDYDIRVSYVLNTGSPDFNNTGQPRGVRPVITLKPGIGIEGNGTYNEPYVVKTTSN